MLPQAPTYRITVGKPDMTKTQNLDFSILSRYHNTLLGDRCPTFLESIVAPSSRVKYPMKTGHFTLKMRPQHYPATPSTKHQIPPLT
jgi:hypothetical protein